jgi:hypothetical protein
MKKCLLIALMIITACEGKLTDEQRRKMKEQMELHKIKHVTEVEITEAAYAKGRQIIASVERYKTDSTALDSVIRQYNGSVRFIIPGKSNALALEQQLIDAYLADESGSLQDNVQKVRNGNVESDSILYTKPVVTKMSDGSESLLGIWNIWLSKKQLILAMDK